MYQMGVISIQKVGSEQPVPTLGQVPDDLSISERYRQIQDSCREKFGSAFCDAVLPATPIWLPPPERGVETPPFGLSWYVWAIIGFVMGKVL